MSTDDDLRQRKPVSTEPAAATPPKSKKKLEDDEDTGSFISFVDVLRVLSGIILLSCLFSWFVTDGESITWGYRPKISRWRTLKALFQPTLHLTPDQLSAFTGEDPSKPIYVAVNGSIFDVSSNPRMYGPGGGYSFFAGRDAARAFVSGCFKDDLTHDLRGLERMYVTGKSLEEDEAEKEEIEKLEGDGVDEVGAGLGMHEKMKAQGRVKWLKSRRAKRWEKAREKVEKQVQHWDKFFRNHDTYFYVGEVLHESLEGKPVWPLCQRGKAKPKEKGKS